MLNHLKSEANIAYTENGAVTNASTMSDCLDLFAGIGALRAADDQEIIRRFVRAYAEDADIAMKILFFGCGIGSPFFSTDTAAVLRAAEIGADVILLAKNIDGVYNCDPAKFANAKKFDSITYDDVLAQHLSVMDSTATSLSMDNHIPVLVFALKDPYNIIRALRGEKIGTIVKEA